MLKLWSKLSRVSLDTLDEGLDTLHSNHHMTMKYELFVSCHGDGCAWRDVFQFADRPEVEIICMLRDKSVETYRALYDQEPASTHLGINIVEPQHRDSLPTIRK